MQTRRAGFTIIELLIVLAVIAIITALAIPRLQRAKLTANETAAIVAMRAIAQAQGQVMSSPSIDSDGDGQGEFGYFAELAGSSVVRVDAGGSPAAGGPQARLTPNALLGALGKVQNSVVVYSGYVFQVWLPGPTVGGLTAGIPEDATGGKLSAPFPDPDNCESQWCAYAWPLVRNGSGMACYFVNSQGQVLIYNNRAAATYSGISGGPGFDAAVTVAGDMNSPMALNGTLGVDGNIWNVLR